MTNTAGDTPPTSDYFENAEAYECFMGCWSRAAGSMFLDWIAPPERAHWLDVGCGTGVFTQMVLDTRAPSAIVAVDPAPAQIEYARRQPAATRADFQIANAENLPFADGTFRIVASALVINFITDRAAALSEMRRVACSGGTVAGFVWDFAAERSPTSIVRVGLRQTGINGPDAPGTGASTLESLHAQFEQAGLEDVATRIIDVTMHYPDFDHFWRAQTAISNPLTKIVAALPEFDRMRLIETVRLQLPAAADGSVSCSARANAVKARVPS